MNSRDASAFSVAAFRRFFAALLLSQVGTWFQTLTVALVVAERTGDVYALSGVAIATFGPTVVLSWFAGRASDRWPPHIISIIAMLSFAISSIPLIVIFLQPEIQMPWMYSALAVAGSASAFQRVAGQSLIYELVGAERLQNAVVWTSLVNAGARVVGPGLAGLAIVLLGPAPSLGLNVLFAAFAALIMGTIRARDLVPRRTARARGIRASALPLPSRVYVVIVLNAIVCFWAMNVPTTVTAIVSIEFQADAAALSAAHALTAIGAVIAAPLLTRIRAATAGVAALGATAFGVAQIATALPGSLAGFLLLCPAFGLGLAFFQSMVAAAVQTGAPPAAIGRATSFVNLGSFGPLPFGAIVLGILLDEFGGRGALAASGVLCAVSAGVALLVLGAIRRREAK